MEYEDIVEKYKMRSHPEGGFYVETFRSEAIVKMELNGEIISRSASTAILFLLTPGNRSRLHRIKSDEVWHFYIGHSITIVELDEADRTAKLTVLGSNISDNELIQYTVKANTWFGSFLNDGGKFGLVGCTVAPGFEFQDFELGSRSKLCLEFPLATDIIIKLTEGLP